MHGNWETWLEFFLEGIHKSAMQAIQTTNLINKLFEEDITQIEKSGRARFVCIANTEMFLPHIRKNLGIDQ